MALVAACSGLTDNADGISSLEVRLPVNMYLEVGRTVTLRAVARNAAGDSVAATLRFLTGDTTITVGETTGLVTALKASGSGRVQVVAFGDDSVFTRPDSLRFTLTARADTLSLTGADSVDVAVDTVGVTIGALLQGGTPLVNVAGRPVTYTLITPAPSDSTVVLGPGRGVDSATTQANGQTAVRVRGKPGHQAPDRAIVDVTAYRADGQKIPGSGRRVVIRFRHQSP